MNEKIMKFKFFKPRGVRISEGDLKWLTHKISMLTSNFKLVCRKLVKCFIAVLFIDAYIFPN